MMKKLFFFTFAAIIALQSVSAQDKGEKYIGGIVGISTTSVSFDGASVSTTNVGFAPEFGYFVADRLRIGASLAYNLASSDGATTHALTIGPSLAYYVKLCDRLYYTPEVGIGFAYSSTEGLSGYGVSAGLALGAFEFRASKRCGISVNLLSLEYAYQSYSDLGAGSNTVVFQLGISPSVGFKYYF